MIIDYDESVGHGRGYPTGLSHEEKMDVVACLLDEGEKTYVLGRLAVKKECRGKGYAKALIQAVQAHIAGMRIYSHISKANLLSLCVHEKCGFRRISEQAVYIDGSVNSRACTLCFEQENTP